MAGARAGHGSRGAPWVWCCGIDDAAPGPTSPGQCCVDREPPSAISRRAAWQQVRQRLAQIGGAMGQSIPLICQDYSIDARGRHDVSTGSMMSGAEEARLSRQRAAPTDSASPRARSARREPIVTRRSSALTRALYRASHATGPNKKSGRAVISTRCFNRSRSCP